MNHAIITPQEVREAEDKLLAAQLSGDTDTLSRLLYDNLTALSPDGEILTKEADLDAYRTGTVVLEEATSVIESMQVTGDTAVTIVTMQGKGTVGGNPLRGTFRYLRTWKRFADGLKIIAAAYRQVS